MPHRAASRASEMGAIRAWSPSLCFLSLDRKSVDFERALNTGVSVWVPARDTAGENRNLEFSLL